MWYRIDPVDRISALSPDWEIFAARNGAQWLAPDRIVGRPIWGFIEGAAAYAFYTRIFESVRQTLLPVHVRLQCDGPGVKRSIGLTISGTKDQTLVINTQTLQEHEVPYQPLWDRQVSRSVQCVTVCSWCKDVGIDPLNWKPIHEAAKADPRLGSALPPNVLYGVCPSCEIALEAELTRVLDKVHSIEPCEISAHDRSSNRTDLTDKTTHAVSIFSQS